MQCVGAEVNHGITEIGINHRYTAFLGTSLRGLFFLCSKSCMQGMRDRAREERVGLSVSLEALIVVYVRQFEGYRLKIMSAYSKSS